MQRNGATFVRQERIIRMIAAAMWQGMAMAVQGAQWSQISIASLFEPVVWQGPDTWGAPFADLLVEFLEAKCETAPADGMHSSACAASPERATAQQQSHSAGKESLSGPCLQRTHAHPVHDQGDDRCFSTDDSSAGPSQTSLSNTPQLTAAQLIPEYPPEPKASTRVSTACVQAQSCEAWHTAFRAVHAPAIGLRPYLQRIGRFSGCSTVCLVYACAYILRLESCGAALTPLTVHRLLGTAIVLAVKHVEDTVWTNAHYARVTGISLTELNRMELLMCSLLDFALWLPGPQDVLEKVCQLWPRTMPQASMQLLSVKLLLLTVLQFVLITTHRKDSGPFIHFL